MLLGYPTGSQSCDNKIELVPSQPKYCDSLVWGFGPEIFWRPTILKLNVLTIRDVRKFFQLLEILNKTEACVVFSCFTFLILSLPCQLPFHELLIALFCSVFFPSSKIGFSHLIFRIGSKIRHPWKRQERSRSSSNLQTSSLQLKAKMCSASLRSRETQSQQSHGSR